MAGYGISGGQFRSCSEMTSGPRGHRIPGPESSNLATARRLPDIGCVNAVEHLRIIAHLK